jgi:anaerobic selenocysteine-containing dehydrogenase
MPARLLERRNEYQLVQVEASKSRTAAFADRWLPARPGTEGAVALAMAKVLVDERLVAPPRALDAVDYLAVLERFSPEQVAGVSGVPAAQIAECARSLGSGSPAIALPPAEPGMLSDAAEIAIAGLNVLIGAKAALAQRRFCPEFPELTEVSDGSAAVILTDNVSDVPGSLLRRKLSPGGVIIAMASHASEIAQAAGIVLPTPAWPEAEEDIPGSPDAPAASFAVAAALAPPPPGVMRSADIVAQICGTSAPSLSARTEEVHRLQAGVVYRYADGSSVSASTMTSEEFSSALAEGGRWVDEHQTYSVPAASVRLLDGMAPAEIVNVLSKASAGPSAAAIGSVMPVVPMLAKLYQESDLYPAPGALQMNPETARTHGLDDGVRASVRTDSGSGTATVRLDDTAPPGLIQISGAPALRLCDGRAQDWRLTAANVRRA